MKHVQLQTLFEYHYGRLDAIWESIMTLTDAQFVQPLDYSHGSLRNQMVHLINDDRKWFALVQNKPLRAPLNRENFTTRDSVHAEHRQLVTDVHAMVAHMDDAFLEQQFLWEQKGLPAPQLVSVWQALLHVVNHGTDHRAQILRILHDFGAPSFDQDLMGYLVQTGQMTHRE